MSILELVVGILELFGRYWAENPISGTLLFLYLFYALYLACAGIYVGWRVFPIWMRFLTSPIAAVMLVVDVFAEHTIACIAFWDAPPPGCWTVTRRVSFYKNNMPNSWRGRLSRAICRNMLDPAQIGGHCS